MTHVLQALRALGRQASASKICDWFGVPRSSAYYQAREAKPRPIDEDLATCIKQLHHQEPACGVRGTWSRVRFIEGIRVNRKKVHRIMKLKGWTLPKRKAGARQRVRLSRSIADRPDQRWATDLALIHCGRDGWCVFLPVIDCCTQEIFGPALEATGRAKTAERALKEALLGRFGTLRNAPLGMLLHHDNGQVFGSRQPRRRQGLRPPTGIHPPQQNRLYERFIKTFKKEFCWCNRFASIEHARLKLRAWIHHYNTNTPNQSLANKTQNQYHLDQYKSAA